MFSLFIILCLGALFLILIVRNQPERSEPFTFPPTRTFCVHVAGVTHKNSDGTSRQKIIRDCSDGETVNLIPEPDNPYDPNAIKVCRLNGEQIGYLDSRLARETDRDHLPYAEIEMVIHKEGTRNHGVIIRLHVPQ